MDDYYQLKKNKRARTFHSNGSDYITKDGHTMLQPDIVTGLNRMRQLEAENAELHTDNSELRGVVKRWELLRFFLLTEITSDTSDYCHIALRAAKDKMSELEQSKDKS